MHGVAAYRRGCRCSVCKAAKADYFRGKRKDGCGWDSRPRHRRACVDCGQVLRSGGHAADGQPRCKLHRDRIRKARRRRQSAQRKLARAAEGTSADRLFVQGCCVWCGSRFVRLGMASPYCSKPCNRKDRRRNERQCRRHQWISHADRFAVYERDGWICQLCNEPIDRTAHYLDDWAPSLDHIEPRSTVLIPDDSPANLRTAHRWCNSVRGDGSRGLFEKVAA